MTLGISITNLAKVLKLASNEDKLSMKADEDGQHLQICFSNSSKYTHQFYLIFSFRIRKTNSIQLEPHHSR